MTSLAGSIFGSSQEKNNNDDNTKNSTTKKEKSVEKPSSGLATLFDASTKLPDKPAHTQYESRKRRTAKTDKKQQQRRKVSDDETDKTTTKEGTDNDDNKTLPTNEQKTNLLNLEAESRTVFVGNLPPGTSRKALANMFRTCGKVESSRLRSMATTGIKVTQDRAGDQSFVKKVCVNTNQVDTGAKTSVQGYVVFAEKDSVDKALAMNNKEVDGHLIRVDRSRPTVDASRSVFVGNLPYQAQESSLRQHFCRGCRLDESDVENVRIIRDKETMQCKGFGYVLFREKSMVSTALQTMHETNYLRRKLRVTVCGKRFKNRQGAPPATAKEDGKDGPGSGSKRQIVDANGALQRILTRDKNNNDAKKRKRGDVTKKSKGGSANPHGLSRRAAVEAKTEKRVKKLKKRAARGMGKQKG